MVDRPNLPLRRFSFGVVLWELMTWKLPWGGSGLSPFQVRLGVPWLLAGLAVALWVVPAC